MLFFILVFQRLAGGEDLGFNNAIFLSEREAADRNYALGFYMREYGCYPQKCNFKESMDFYFQVSNYLTEVGILRGDITGL